VYFPGPRTGADLDRSYAAADLMVLASRAETYGMVVTEALARGLPVVAAEVGGLPEALGHGTDGIRPGLLVPPDDPAALGAALRAWLGDAELRERLRRAACQRRQSLSGWSTTTSVVAGVLAEASR
jgi:glycosyltransferase involved in cell wall biosynthesis